MRPELLELKNFTTFRTVSDPIDFTEIDLFALTGATGAGKTSVIDAICFALYGEIPRAGGVEPVIALGTGEARVKLDFKVAGRGYTAARVVRRTKTGATTAEARLEREGSVLASGAKDVTHEVERLLGLSFEHFTRCVVLPQGEFAAFLHETPAGRQKLMRTLLDLGLFERIRSAARSRQSGSEQVVAALQTERDGLGDITQALIDAAKEHVVRIRSIRNEIDGLIPRRSEALALIETTGKELDELDRSLSSLGGLRRPVILDQLSSDVGDLEAEIGEVTNTTVEVVAEIEETEKALAGQPDRAELQAAQVDWTRHVELMRSTELATAEQEAAKAAADEATAGLEQAEGALRGAVDDRTALERAHAAHALATGLTEGEACPVCLRIIDEIPQLEMNHDLETAKKSVDLAEQRVLKARQRLTTTHADLARSTAQAEALHAERLGLEARLAGHPEKERVDIALSLRDKTEEQLESLRSVERSTTRTLQALHTRRTALMAELKTVERLYTEARDSVSWLGGLPTPSGDAAERWERLLEWREEETSRRHDMRAGVVERNAAADRMLEEVDENVRRVVSEGFPDLEWTDVSLVVETLIRAESDADNQVGRLVASLGRLTEIEKRIKEAHEAAEVAKELAKLLSARGFEPWLMQEAMMALVVGANVLLDELAGGGYSLHVDDGAFSVVDHRNADDMRPAKTLSGGETFLVSLALALSLAEHVRTVAGGAAIESVFIDEGFGSLDAASLDVVSSVLHRLGERQQMVGIVTHVTELALQMPVRFEVEKTPAGSRIERVDA